MSEQDEVIERLRSAIEARKADPSDAAKKASRYEQTVMIQQIAARTDERMDRMLAALQQRQAARQTRDQQLEDRLAMLAAQMDKSAQDQLSKAGKEALAARREAAVGNEIGGKG